MTDPGSSPARARARARRLSDRATFERLRREGVRASSGPLSVLWLAEPGSERRVAYAIGRRVGGAVVRNRIRRRLREIVDHAAHDMPPGAWLVRAHPEANRLTFADLEDHLRAAAGRAVRGGSR